MVRSTVSFLIITYLGPFLSFPHLFQITFFWACFYSSPFTLCMLGICFVTRTFSTPTISAPPSVECKDLLIPTRLNACAARIDLGLKSHLNDCCQKEGGPCPISFSLLRYFKISTKSDNNLKLSLFLWKKLTYRKVSMYYQFASYKISNSYDFIDLCRCFANGGFEKSNFKFLIQTDKTTVNSLLNSVLIAFAVSGHYVSVFV